MHGIARNFPLWPSFINISAAERLEIISVFRKEFFGSLPEVPQPHNRKWTLNLAFILFPGSELGSFEGLKTQWLFPHLCPFLHSGQTLRDGSKSIRVVHKLRDLIVLLPQQAAGIAAIAHHLTSNDADLKIAFILNWTSCRLEKLSQSIR